MGRLTPPLPTRHRLIILATLAVAVAYGLMNMSYPWTLLSGQVAWSNRLLMTLVSDTFVTGSPHTPQWLANYARALGSIAVHAGVGGLALSLCALQFIPGLRQRSPRTHRVIGWAAVCATVLAMAGSAAFLWATPLQEGFGGPTFGIGLWLLALSTLMSIAMGVVTALQRRWREHMGWMTMVGALLLTAPLLRVGDVALGRWLPIRIDDAANLLVGGLTTVSFWMCLWWAQRAGQRDMPLPAPQAVLPPAAWSGIAALGVVMVAHETLLAPHGLDLLRALGHPRTTGDLLPQAATGWGLLTLLVLPLSARVLRHDAQRPEAAPLPRTLAWLTLAQGLAALWLASTWGAGGWSSYNQATLTGTWAFSGAVSVAWSLAALAGRLDGRDAGRARVMGLIHHMGPGAWVLMLAFLPWLGLDVGTMLAAAAMLGQGWVAWYGGASALGLTLPGAPRLQAAAQATTATTAGTPSTSNALA